MSGKLDNEHELIKKAQRGDPIAFGDLYESHAPAIFRYLFSHLDNQMDAEDLTGEVFLKAWRSLPKYRERGVPFLAFLFRIARNIMVDHYRKNNHLETKDPQEMDGYSAEVILEPIDLIGSQIEHQKILHVLHRLRSDYQSVLTLRFISELSPEETAQVMKRSVGAIRVLQHRALAALREEMDESKENMKIERQIDQIIISNLPAIIEERESIESVLARYPEIASELRPRLEAALWLHQVRLSVATRPGFIHDSRKYLETQIESMQPHSFMQRFFRSLTPKRWVYNFAAITLMIISLGAVISDLILTARLSIPNEPLYSTKLVLEDIQLALTFNQTAKTDLYIQLSAERTTEFVELAIQGDYEYLPTAARRLESEITATLDSLEDFPIHEQDNKQATLVKLRETLTNEIIMLNMLKWTSPPSAMTGINLAIQVAQSGMYALH